MQSAPRESIGDRLPRLPDGRIPSLDGLRGVAVLLVVAAHLLNTRGFLQVADPKRVHLGDVAVRAFFALSGFLITTLLLEEHRRTGTIGLERFYLRRSARIFPAFYAYVGAIAALAFSGVLALRPGDLLHAATFTTNYHYDRAWPLGHLWTLAVEEQFYLLWPTVFLLAGPRRAFRIAAGVLVASPVLRVTAYLAFPSLRGALDEIFPTIADAIAVGCLLAGLRDWLGRQPLYLRLLGSPWAVLLPVAAVAVNATCRWPKIHMPLGQTLTGLLLALLLDHVTHFPERALGRVLNTRPMIFVGQISYSLYLWQQLFLDRSSSAWYAAFPQNLILSFALGAASYYGVERTFLALWGPALKRRRAGASGEAA